jgi:hypothetical protein
MCLLEKLLSYTITEVDKRCIERKIGNFCFEYVENILDNFVSSNFALYERDDTGPIDDEYYCYDNYFHGINDWGIINEPVKFNINQGTSSYR